MSRPTWHRPRRGHRPRPAALPQRGRRVRSPRAAPTSTWWSATACRRRSTRTSRRRPPPRPPAACWPTAVTELPKQHRAGHHRGGAVVAALAATGDPRRAASNPACTIVAPACVATEIGYGWVGDSRAYWMPADGPAEQLTEDDSWATHAIALGADPKPRCRIRRRTPSPRGWAPTPGRSSRAPASSGSPRPGIWCCAATACGTTSPTRGLSPTRSAGTWDAELLERRPVARRRSPTTAGGADNITVALIPVSRPRGGPRGVHRRGVSERVPRPGRDRSQRDRHGRLVRRRGRPPHRPAPPRSSSWTRPGRCRPRAAWSPPGRPPRPR